MKTFLEKTSSLLEKFFSKDAFIYFSAIFTLITSFLNRNMLTATLWLIILSLIFFTQKDTKACFPVLILIFFSFNSINGDFGINAIFIVAIAIFVASIIFNLCYFKQKLTFTSTIKSSILLVFALILSGIFANGNNLLLNGGMLLAGILVLFIFSFITSTAKINADYLMKILVCLGLIVLIQCLFAVTLLKGVWGGAGFSLNWGIYNGVIVTYQFVLPALIYFVFKSEKYNFLFVILLNIICASILLTNSRAGMVILIGEMGVIDLFLLFWFRKNKKILYTTLAIITFGILLVLGILIIKPEIFTQIFRKFLAHGLSLNGRHLQWQMSREYFFKYPIFGVGIFHDYYDMAGSVTIFWHSHQIFLQLLSSMGIFGFCAYILHLIYKFKSCARPTLFNVMALIMLICSEVYGLIDVTFPSPNFMILVFSVMIAIDAINAQSTKK